MQIKNTANSTPFFGVLGHHILRRAILDKNLDITLSHPFISFTLIKVRHASSLAKIQATVSHLKKNKKNISLSRIFRALTSQRKNKNLEPSEAERRANIQDIKLPNLALYKLDKLNRNHNTATTTLW